MHDSIAPFSFLCLVLCDLEGPYTETAEVSISSVHSELLLVSALELLNHFGSKVLFPFWAPVCFSLHLQVSMVKITVIIRVL